MAQVLYTIEELLHGQESVLTPSYFLHQENLDNYRYKDVFFERADIKKYNNKNDKDKINYLKGSKTIIYNPDLLLLIWQYREKKIRRHLLSDNELKKYISDIYQYINIFLKEIPLVKDYYENNQNIVLNYSVKKEWLTVAFNTVTRIKMDFNRLLKDGLLPDEIYLYDINNLTYLYDDEDDTKKIDMISALKKIGITINDKEVSMKR